MSESAVGAIVLTAELLFVTLTVLGVIIYRALTQRRRTRDAVSQFAKRWKTDLPQRRASMRRSLEAQCGWEEAQAAEHTATLLERERSVFRTAIDMLLRRDPGGLGRLSEGVTALTAAYQALAGQQHGGGVDAAARPDEEPGGQDADAGKRLRRENDRLVAENARLKSDIETMEQQVVQAKREVENVLKEYASMYEGSREGGERKVDEHKKKARRRSETPAGQESAPPEAD